MNRRELLKLSIGGIYGLATFPLAKNLLANGRTSLMLDASVPPLEVLTNFLKMGTSLSPDGNVLIADSRSLLVNNRRWMPVMGEMHYSRYPEKEWREELLRMKMGGIEIVATYVFWIHHEEIKDQFDWTGRRNLRGFIKLCNEIGLHSIVRLGPWCHGEVRNGGLPDWLLKMGVKPRTDDPQYLERVKILYAQIAKQFKGLGWKDGGKLIGCQFENEFSGRAEHLLNLKKIGLACGIDLPIYTRTSWNRMASPMPLGELIPLYGGYSDGFWDRSILPMPGKHGDAFLFQNTRSNPAIATDTLSGDRKDSEDASKYPYFCCEIGGGMITSYHRRIISDPSDIESLSVVKMGSGNNLQGFYMYHGGTNPQGKLTTLQESQATNYANDMPVKSYEFQAPLGEFGQIHPHYHGLRLHNNFMRDFGENLADMTAFSPVLKPADNKDTTKLRWAARSDGKCGYIFVNNYQRLQEMPAKADVQFEIAMSGETVKIPQIPINIPQNSFFFMPYNMAIADAKLLYATAQPICRLDEPNDLHLFFAEIVGIKPEFVFDKTAKFIGKRGNALRYRSANGQTISIHLFDAKAARSLWKENFAGRERVFSTKAGLVIDGDKIRLRSQNTADLRIGIYPHVKLSGAKMLSNDGTFQWFQPSVKAKPAFPVEFTKTKVAGAARIAVVSAKGAAIAPSDAEFDAAAEWEIKLPRGIETGNTILRLKYTGDVARIYSGETLLTDNFYNGNAFEIGINRFAPTIYTAPLKLQILPLRKDAPIYLETSATPDFKNAESICELESAELIEIFTSELKTA